VLEDDLSGVLESLKAADVVRDGDAGVLFDVPGQVKCFIDRTYSYMPAGYLSRQPITCPGGEKACPLSSPRELLWMICSPMFQRDIRAFYSDRWDSATPA